MTEQLHRCDWCGAWGPEPRRRCDWCDSPEAQAYADEQLDQYYDKLHQAEDYMHQDYDR